MKKIKLILLATILLSACKATKLNSAGKEVPTANTRHLLKIHKSGTMWAGKNYIVIKKEK